MGTFADYLATGRGAVAWSLEIEGCKYVFCSENAMEGSLGDGRYRVRGLQSEGIQIQESVYLAGAELNISLSSLQIVETTGAYRDAATEVFTGWTAQAVKTWLAPVTVLPSDTTGIKVRSAAGMTIGEDVHIGTEVWRITGITTGSGITDGVVDWDRIDVARSRWLTTAQGFPALSAGPTGTAQNIYKITSQPASYAGRRIWLRGHGTSELGLASGGTLVFRGILADNPALSDSRTWSLSLEPRTKLLDGEIGQGGPGGTTLRGAYYPGRAPLDLGVYVCTTATRSESYVASFRVILPGFFETQEAFVTALQAKLDAVLGAYCTPIVFVDARGAWGIKIVADGSTPRYVSITGGSAIDGWFNGNLLQSASDSLAIPPVNTVAASHEYTASWSGDSSIGFSGSLPGDQVRLMPRANYHPGMARRGSDADVAAWPHTRFYLSSVAGLTTGAMTVTPPKINESDPDPDPIQLPIGTTSALGYVEVFSSDAWRIDHVTTGGLSGFAASGSLQPTFDIAARYGSTDGCNLGAFLAAVLIESPNSANVGTTPWLTSDDIDVNGITTEVLAAISGASYLARRDYVFGKRRKLSEILREELKLHGMFLCLASDGKITAKRFPQDVSSTVATINADTHTPVDDFGTERLSPDGIVTEVDLKLGYIARDDKWATEWNFPSVGGAATAKSKGQKLEITPFVRAHAPLTAAPDGMTPEDAAARVQSVLGWFGDQYYVISVPVSIEQHARRLGDSVLVTILQLPNGGARGSTRAGTGLFQTRATVVGRTWQYGDSPTGTLDLFVHGLNIAGYTPSLLVAYETSGSGTTWTFHCNDDVFGPRQFTTEAPADASFFEAGFKIVMREHDADSPRRYTGTVTSVVGDGISIEFDEAFPGLGTATWIIGFDAANVVIPAQRVYCFLADPMGRVQYSDSSVPARLFS